MLLDESFSMFVGASMDAMSHLVTQLLLKRRMGSDALPGRQVFSVTSQIKPLCQKLKKSNSFKSK